MRIYLDKQYGLNRDTIEFVPYCKDEIEISNYIEYDKYTLVCIEKGKFQIVTDNPNDSILGSDLLNNEWKLWKAPSNNINLDLDKFVDKIDTFKKIL